MLKRKRFEIYKLQKLEIWKDYTEIFTTKDWSAEALVWWSRENTDIQEVGREFELSPGYWMDGSFGLVVMGEYWCSKGRSWVQIPAQVTGWTFYLNKYVLSKICPFLVSCNFSRVNEKMVRGHFEGDWILNLRYLISEGPILQYW